MCDFEKSLRLSLKDNFPTTSIYGCYFHYAKAIWQKLKKLGFTTKKFKAISLFISSFMKLLPFMSRSMRLKQYDTLKKEVLEKFSRFFVYYDKNWLNSDYLNMNSLDYETKIRRTNNSC